MQNYWSKEKIEEVKALTDSAFSKKGEYEGLWRKIAAYCGLNKYFYQQQSNDRKEDFEINNSQAVTSLNQSSDSMLGILIGDGNFFKLKIKDRIEDKVKEVEGLPFNKSTLEEYLEFVNFTLRENFFYKDSCFTKNLHKTIKEYFAFGNAGMGVFSEDNQEVEESKLNFVNYSINNCAFMEGKDGEVDTIFIKYQWSAKKIVETFCLNENGEVDQGKFEELGEKIKNDYKDGRDRDKLHQVNYIFMKNPERKKGVKEGKYSANWCGVYLDFEDNKVIDCQYYKNKQFKIIRDNLRTGETYGKGLAGAILGEIELLNKITGDTVENIENTVRPYLYTYENVLNGSKLELDRNKLTVLKPATNNPSSQPPIAPLLQAGDIASTVQFLIPQLQDNIATGLKADIFLDFNSKSDMTATETQIRNNIRNKVLFANALDFQNLLNCLIYNSYYILFRGKHLNRKDETIKFFEENYFDWFDIEYTSELAQIAKNSEIEQTLNFLQSVALVAQLAPQDKQGEIIGRIDFNKVNEMLATLYNKNNLLFTEEEFKRMMEEKQQTEQQLLNQQQQLNDADTTNKQADAVKKLAEANNLKKQEMVDF